METNNSVIKVVNAIIVVKTGNSFWVKKATEHFKSGNINEDKNVKYESESIFCDSCLKYPHWNLVINLKDFIKKIKKMKGEVDFIILDNSIPFKPFKSMLTQMSRFGLKENIVLTPSYQEKDFTFYILSE